MSGNKNRVDGRRAAGQWTDLYEAISNHANVSLIDPAENQPDMVFAANAGFVHDKTVVLSNFTHKERKGEEEHFAWYFKEHGYKVVRVTKNFEGQGDLLRDPSRRLWLGTGFRTDPEIVPELEEHLGVINRLTLVDPRWYHLDTCFCPLPKGEVLWYPNAFDSASRDLIRSSFPVRISVTEDQAVKFVCNTVSVGLELFFPKGGETLTKLLGTFGYHVTTLNFSEFMLSGGAAQCLVLYLD